MNKIPISKESYERLEAINCSDQADDYNKQVQKLKKLLKELPLRQYSILTTAMMELTEPIIKENKPN